MEEQVIQEAPVAQPEQPVAAETSAPDPVAAVKADYEAQLSALKTQATEAEERFQGIKTKLDEVYKKQDDQRKKTLEDQGQWKDLWEEGPPSASLVRSTRSKCCCFCRTTCTAATTAPYQSWTKVLSKTLTLI
jgi:hypothetical protein